MSALRLSEHGAQLFADAATCDIDQLRASFEHLPQERAGSRLQNLSAIRTCLQNEGSIGAIASALIGPNSRAVRAIAFDKNATTNWSLAWHQDRTICVQERIDAPGFGPWTLKAGLHHVAPPFDILSRMVTLRVHLDDVPAGNAPLLISPGSHLAGRVAEHCVEETVKRHGSVACLARAGDIWAYATPILHASQAAAKPTSRRVLQFDFAAEELPHGLKWRGV